MTVMDKGVVQELVNKGYVSVKIETEVGQLEVVMLTIPFAEKVGFKEKK